MISDEGEGTFEECSICNNKFIGIAISNGRAPVFRKCQINQNEFYGVLVIDQGKGLVENCDLTGNPRGPWLIKNGSGVRSANNKI